MSLAWIAKWLVPYSKHAATVVVLLFLEFVYTSVEWRAASLKRLMAHVQLAKPNLCWFCVYVKGLGTFLLPRIPSGPGYSFGHRAVKVGRPGSCSGNSLPLCQALWKSAGFFLFLFFFTSSSEFTHFSSYWVDSVYRAGCGWLDFLPELTAKAVETIIILLRFY